MFVISHRKISFDKKYSLKTISRHSGLWTHVCVSSTDSTSFQVLENCSSFDCMTDLLNKWLNMFKLDFTYPLMSYVSLILVVNLHHTSKFILKHDINNNNCGFKTMLSGESNSWNEVDQKFSNWCLVQSLSMTVMMLRNVNLPVLLHTWLVS